ncbi:MAG: PilZ domain-containing protein, partial [Deltaproteobacteria bacterium]|nr:PilZ domain-containing protein [Deltaproteobacteria bacterium]
YPRTPIRTQVVFENQDSDGELYFFAKDISAGGIFIEAEMEVEIGSQVFLRFSLTPHSKPIQATGEVVRVMRDNNRLGVGIHFVYIHPLDRQLIQDFIEKGSGA